VEYKEAHEYSDAELIQVLTERYRPSEIPPCRVCGKSLTIQAIGGGKPTWWGCSGFEDVPGKPNELRYTKGRHGADEHYSQSRYEDRRAGGDSRVMELIKRFLDACEV